MKVWILFEDDGDIYGVFSSFELAEKIQSEMREVQHTLWFDEYPVESE